MDWDGYYAVGFEFGIHLFAIDALLYAGIPLAGHAYILGVYDGYAPGGGGGAGAGGAGAGDGGGGGGDGGPPYHGADVHGLNPGNFNRYIVRFKGVTQIMNGRQLFCLMANPMHFDHLPPQDGLREGVYLFPVDVDPDAPEDEQWASVFVGLQDHHDWEFVMEYPKRRANNNVPHVRLWSCLYQSTDGWTMRVFRCETIADFAVVHYRRHTPLLSDFHCMAALIQTLQIQHDQAMDLDRESTQAIRNVLDNLP